MSPGIKSRSPGSSTHSNLLAFTNSGKRSRSGESMSSTSDLSPGSFTLKRLSDFTFLRNASKNPQKQRLQVTNFSNFRAEEGCCVLRGTCLTSRGAMHPGDCRGPPSSCRSPEPAGCPSPLQQTWQIITVKTIAKSEANWCMTIHLRKSKAPTS